MSTFTPTSEWQEVGAGQAVPPGCHVRLNMETGLREAKIAEGSTGGNSQAVVLAESTPSDKKPTETATAATKQAARSPKDWQGLLKWSLNYMDGTKRQEDVKEMDPQRRAWLKKAMEALSVDEAKLMQEALKVLCDGYELCFEAGRVSDSALRAKENALEGLLHLVDSLDNAQDLIPLGGFPAVIGLLDAAYPSLQWRAADVLATCVQNNPRCQDYCLQNQGLEKLLAVSSKAEGDVQTKALYALAGLVRDHDASLHAFLLGGGLDVLRKTMSSYQTNPKAATKAVFLLSQLVSNETVTADQAAQTALQPVSQCLGSSDWALRENSLRLVAAMAQGSSFKQLAAQPGVDIRERVTAISKTIESQPDQEAHEEEIQFIRDILSALAQ